MNQEGSISLGNPLGTDTGRLVKLYFYSHPRLSWPNRARFSFTPLF